MREIVRMTWRGDGPAHRDIRTKAEGAGAMGLSIRGVEAELQRFAKRGATASPGKPPTSEEAAGASRNPLMMHSRVL